MVAFIVKRLEEAFGADAGGDAHISEDVGLANGLTEEQFEEMGENGDGKIDRNEFTDWKSSPNSDRDDDDDDDDSRPGGSGGAVEGDTAMIAVASILILIAVGAAATAVGWMFREHEEIIKSPVGFLKPVVRDRPRRALRPGQARARDCAPPRA